MSLQNQGQWVDDPDQAVERLHQLYTESTAQLRQAFEAYARGVVPQERVRAFYPQLAIEAGLSERLNLSQSYGFVSNRGRFATTITRPDLFAEYYREQIGLLLSNHAVPVQITRSNRVIPVHFAFNEDHHLEADLSLAQRQQVGDYFDLPDLKQIDDRIVNGTYQPQPGAAHPLALFEADRVDFSLHRLKHYTGTSPVHFQHFVLYTNYQFYVDEFIHHCQQLMQATSDPAAREQSCQYTAFVEPGDVVTPNANLVPTSKPIAVRSAPLRLPQMPAYHLKRANGSGITLVNIGVGPSNAKTITDHIAVLRPHAWLMLGHCAGLRSTQRLGDYVLAHGYVRQDHVLDDDLPLWVPVPALAEVQQALEAAVAQVTRLEGADLKKIMRTGTVASVDDRNWELRDWVEPLQRLSQSRAVALDMESATIAANGFRLRVPYGTLLCVSDKPLHSEMKFFGMADQFYQAQVKQHLQIGLCALERLRESGLERLHSRKLRCFAEVAFR